jgi:hypothetical protein
VAALDIDPDVIQEAAHAATDERKPHYLAPWGSGEDGWYIRWAQLEVAVWLGRLQDPNPSFHGFDAIVSTEVSVQFSSSQFDISRAWVNAGSNMSQKLCFLRSRTYCWEHTYLASYSLPRPITPSTPDFTLQVSHAKDS